MTARASESASRFASVPELQKRTRSIAGKRAHDRLRKRRLVAVRRAEHDPVRERLTDRLEDHRMRVAVEAGGVLAEEVDVLVAVGVDDARALARGRW